MRTAGASQASPWIEYAIAGFVFLQTYRLTKPTITARMGFALVYPSVTGPGRPRLQDWFQCVLLGLQGRIHPSLNARDNPRGSSPPGPARGRRVPRANAKSRGAGESGRYRVLSVTGRSDPDPESWPPHCPEIDFAFALAGCCTPCDMPTTCISTPQWPPASSSTAAPSADRWQPPHRDRSTLPGTPQPRMAPTPCTLGQPST